MISFIRATRKKFMVATSRAWYNGSYTMAAKPIKTLELHYTMIQFLINGIVSHCIVLYRTVWCCIVYIALIKY